MLPFALLLLCIAVAPLIVRYHWERYYHLLCVTLAAIPSGYYLLVLGSGAAVCSMSVSNTSASSW